MPLNRENALTNLFKTLSESSAANDSKANARYCDSENSRHLSSFNTLCSYASPLITGLVPEEHKHRRMRNGLETSHYSFNSIQSASHLLRLNTRFESVDNDRQEDVVDLLNYIANKSKDSQSLLSRVVTQVETEGTICTLLKQICEAFRASLISESPQMEAVARNTAFIMDYTAKQVQETQKLNIELLTYRTDHLNLLEEVLDKKSETKRKALTEMASIKEEIQVTNSAVERMDGNFQMIGMDLKQELVEMRHEISSMKEEIRSMRDAIIDILPEKIMNIYSEMQSSPTSRASNRSSPVGSDLELIDSENFEQVVAPDSEKTKLLSESSSDSDSETWDK